METSKAQSPYIFTEYDLKPIVCDILDISEIESLKWSIRSLGGGAAEHLASGLGVYRIQGVANDGTQNLPWSVILKGLHASDNESDNDPNSWSYWKREILAYQSGILDTLPGNVSAPRCYRIDESDNGVAHLWLEDIQEVNAPWSMKYHQLAARHFGQFNGAYATGYPLPHMETWMMPGRTRQWLDLYPATHTRLMAYSKMPIGEKLFSDEIIARISRLWENRKLLLAKFDEIPTCFCHHDAFRRNLMLRQNENDMSETVAIDWSMMGPGKLGQEIGIMTAVNLTFLEVDITKASELDKIIFEGYCQGLIEAKWQGDLKLVRFGYTTTAVLAGAVAGMCGWMEDIIAVGSDVVETIIGYPIADIIDQWVAMQYFLLELGDEALTLMDSI